MDFKSLREEKRYDVVIEYYQSHRDDEFSKWDKWNYIMCLKLNNQLDEAEVESQRLFDAEPDFFYNKNLLTWIIYEKYVRDSEYVSEDLIEKSELILDISEHSPSSSYEKTCWKMIELYKDVNPEKVLYWVKKLDVHKLSDEPNTYEKKNQKILYQSNKEHYYAILTKSLFKLELFDECIIACEEAINALDKFHHDNDIWIKARLYYSICITQSDSDMLREIENLNRMKKHFTLFHYLFKLHIKFDDNAAALHNAKKGCLTKEPDQMKLKLYFDFATFLSSIGEHDLSRKHFTFYLKIREKNDWPVDEQLSNLCSDLMNKYNLKSIKKELVKYWKDSTGSDVTYEGSVIKFNSDKGFGFISFKEDNVFFHISNLREKNTELHKGDKVRFSIKTGYNKKKGIEQEEAYDIEIIKGDD